RLLVEHHNNHKLFKTKRNPTVPSEAFGEGRDDNDEPLDLDVSNPVYVYDQFQDDPSTGSTSSPQAGSGQARLIYYPKSLDPDNHQGITKDQLVAQTQGFNIILTEKSQFLPQENENQIVNQGKPNQRKRIENNKTPIEYLNLLNPDPASVQDFGEAKQYQGESYLIIEDWLTQFIIRLEQTNQVSNDWNDNNAAWLPGNYLPPTLQEKQNGSLGELPSGYWSRGDRKAKVGWGYPDLRGSEWGALPSVRI
ncbi:MAG: hypothetical protein Q8R55_03070, partial [Candidatus Taylorbacteria bacterium]|nr:hypothetical protein [Candidatus Taylorbacteria bacterium]